MFQRPIRAEHRPTHNSAGPERARIFLEDRFAKSPCHLQKVREERSFDGEASCMRIVTAVSRLSKIRGGAK